MLSDDFRLLIVDEPTSSMDALAENDIFERFLAERRSITTIFVSHRFGKLARRADVIL
jgi:ABC-type transport system involved in cytochrome bd biosynthesis fused ATPase/permease subunit